MNPYKQITTLLLTTLLSYSTPATSQQISSHYQDAYNTLLSMLEGNTPLSMKKAVYTVENAFFEGELNEQGFNRLLSELGYICKMLAGNNLISYSQQDFNSVNTHAALFKVMTDTIPIQLNDSTLWYHLPFQYNFEDYAGKKEWTSMFVSTLLATHKGNCHSLPLLYMLLAEELGEKAWLSLAPNHFYIKLHNKQHGWYNVELTSGEFPTDAWIKASGYVHLDAIKNGMYMDTLSVKQTVALCLTDLAQGYERKYPDSYDPAFVLKCCNSTLSYFPNYINALLLKAETLHYIYERGESKQQKEYEEIINLLSYIHKTGYRKMPEEMYLKWLRGN